MRIGDRRSLTWVMAFAYLVYSAMSDIPALAGYALFSLNVSSLLFVFLYLFHSYVNLGLKTAAKYLVIAGALGYAFELFSIYTGWVGRYVYTADLAPFLGPIPVFIPLLWASLGYFCMLAADNYAVSAVLMVLLDVAFDPRFSQTLWRWVPPGQYFGVPLMNFVGWFVTAATIYAVFYLASRRKARSSRVAIIFYLLLGLINGALPDMVTGLYTAGLISAVLFAAAALLIYLNFRRLEKNAARAASHHATRPDAPA